MSKRHSKINHRLSVEKSIYPCEPCRGKRTYMSRAAADEAAKSFRDSYRWEGPAMRPYRCPVEPRWVGEERWHVGHNPYPQARGWV